MSEPSNDLHGAADIAPSRAGRNYRRWALILICVGALLWSIFAWGVMPRLIEAAYNGKHVPVLSKALDNKDAWPLEHYQAKFSKLALAALVGMVGPALLILAVTTRWFSERIVGVARPGTLGAIRVVIALILLWISATNSPHKVVNLPPSERKPMGVITKLYDGSAAFNKLPNSSTGLSVLKVATIVTLAMCVVGFRTRFALVAASALYLILAGIPRSYYSFNHSGIVPWYCLCVLCFTRCADGWSVDRLIRQWRGKPVPPMDVPEARYAWGRHLVWCVIAIPYVLAGLSKLFNGSFMWWEVTNLQRILYADAFREDWIDHARLDHMAMMPAWLFVMSGIGTLAIELGMGLTLVSVWVRRILPPFAAVMHVGIVVLQKIPFYDLMWIQLVFWDWTPLPRWIGNKLNARFGKLQVFYDPRSSAQQRWARILPGLDLFHRLTFIESPGEMGIRVGCERMGDPASDCTGASAARALAAALPLGWVAYPILCIPGIASAIGRLTSLGDSRGLQLADGVRRPGASATGYDGEAPSTVPAFTAWRRNFAAVSFALLIVMFLGGWTVRVESYPLTSWQMFSEYDDSGKVLYYRVYQTDEAGKTGIADLKKMLLGDNRYRATLKQAFVTRAGREVASRMLTLCATAWNKKAPPGERVEEFRIVCREWDFENHLDDPDLGRDTEWFKLEFDPSDPSKKPTMTQSSIMPVLPPAKNAGH